MAVTKEAKVISSNGNPTNLESSSDHVTALKGVVDLSDTVDTDREVKQLPPVIHEFIQPTEHHTTHEQIVREIHYHDVYHRVLPVIDLEILPTKHYIVDPDRPGTLKEIPESEAPVKNNWSITPNITLATNPSVSVTKDDPISPTSSTSRHCHPSEKAQPILSSKKSYMTREGFTRTEYVWRHPPTFDMSAYNQGKTVPLRMNCMSSPEFAEYLATQPKHTHPTNRDLSNTSHSDVQEVTEMQKYAQTSLLKYHAKTVHSSAAINPSLERIGNQTQVTKDSLRSSEAKKEVAEEALLAAETAIAVAEEVVAAAQNDNMHQRKSYAGARSSWGGMSDMKDEAKPQHISWHGNVDGVGNTRGKMRARLQKARKSMIEVGQRLRRQ